MPSEPKLPEFLAEIVDRFVGPEGREQIAIWMRPPDLCMTPVALSAMKSTRTSFARVLARHMIRDRWRIVGRQFACDAEGDGRAIYDITIGMHRLTYIARMFRWDGVEKVGRRSDGAYRDMCGAVFVGTPDDQRIAEEFAVLDRRDADTMRSRGDVTGWTPANRSVRFFDHVVDRLAAGQQPDPAVIGSGAGYLLRNGGYLGSGRFGTLSIEGYPAGHPLSHPFFGDLFGLLLVRQVSIDMVEAIAAARSPAAARLAPEIARYIGVGNSSGQGMCVALLDRAIDYYGSVQVPNEELIVPHHVIVANLRSIRDWVADLPRGGPAMPWGTLAARATAAFDAETAEQFNALLIECYPEFADAAADYLPIGAARVRDVQPDMPVAKLRKLLHDRYAWALRMDLGHSELR